MDVTTARTLPERPWAVEAEELARALDVDPAQGLSGEEAVLRRARYGSNRLDEQDARSLWSLLWAQFASPLIGLLVAACVAAALWGELLEATAIIIVVVVNTALGFFTELRAVRSMEALFRVGHARTRVRRDGVAQIIDADDVVPGDVMLIEAGDVVTADARVVEASHLQSDESTLTGESTPVRKGGELSPDDAPLSDRVGMVYRGTAVARGSAVALVVATGMGTEVGQISSLVQSVPDEPTPLERQLSRLGYRLLAVTLLIAAGVTALGILVGKDLVLMIETGIALAIATIPEGLPVVATIALAQGIRHMARRHALIRRLGSVETLGSTNVILTDKTGTLTQNRMSVRHVELTAGGVDVDASGAEPAFVLNGEAVAPSEGSDLAVALQVGALCSTASLGTSSRPAFGDPLELALLEAAQWAGLSRDGLLTQEPELDRWDFDPDAQRMATRHGAPGREWIAAKGAPDRILTDCTHALVEGDRRPLDDETRRLWQERNSSMASEGLRVIALALRREGGPMESPFQDLTWVGLVGMLDPPRTGVRGALALCQSAGIDVVIVTGDQAGTALNVARSLGLEPDATPVLTGEDLDRTEDAPSTETRLQTRLFARVTPRHKLDLVVLHQSAGATVAMTGDGVNDAPALRQADIGIAMGLRGTEVAQEAADMILEDDSFDTIVAAVQLGRTTFDNIRAFVVYLLSCNVSEVMVVTLGAVLPTPLPVLPLQLLYLNFVTDVFPALALGLGEGSVSVMKRPPRPRQEPIVPGRSWRFIVTFGALMTASVLGALVIGLEYLDLGPAQATTVSFLTLALAQLWHVFTMRDPASPVLHNEITRNRWVWRAVLLCLALTVGAVYTPPLAAALNLAAPGPSGWALALGLSLFPALIGTLRGRIRV